MFVAKSFNKHNLHSAGVSPALRTSPAASAPDPRTSFYTEVPETAGKLLLTCITLMTA